MSSNLPLTKNFGSEVSEKIPELAKELDDMYTDIANALSFLIKKNVLTGSSPPANDQRNSFFSVGDISVRTDTNAVWVMTSRTTPTAVTWTLVS